MEEKKSLTQQELAEIRLTTSKSVISTFQDVYDLKKIKRWAVREWNDHLVLWGYMEQVRMACLEKGKGDLWKKWKKKHKMSFVGFDTLNNLMGQLDK